MPKSDTFSLDFVAVSLGGDKFDLSAKANQRDPCVSEACQHWLSKAYGVLFFDCLAPQYMVLSRVVLNIFCLGDCQQSDAGCCKCAGIDVRFRPKVWQIGTK